MRGAAGTIIRRTDGRARAKNSDPRGGEDLRKIKVQRFHSNNRRTRRIDTVANRISIITGRSVRAHRESGAAAGGRRPLCRSRVEERSAVAVVLKPNLASELPPKAGLNEVSFVLILCSWTIWPNTAATR